jgi:hypothetical protein
MWHESKQSKQDFRVAQGADPRSTAIQVNDSKITGNPAMLSFEAGQIFSRFDSDGDGRLNKTDFEKLIASHSELLAVPDGKHDRHTATTDYLPIEVVSGKLLTFYDETAGVAIPKSEAEQHRAIGNTVVPIADAYRARYDRLRGLLTGKLLPRREHLLQLHRQLQNCSSDVANLRKGIERETTVDAEQIIERLRSAEAMRQAAIKHQVNRNMVTARVNILLGST